MIGRCFRIVENSDYYQRIYVVLGIEESNMIVLYDNGTFDTFDVNYIQWEGDVEIGTPTLA